MNCLVFRVFTDGRVQSAELARTWKARQELIRLGVFLQPTVAALHVAAKIWSDLKELPSEVQNP